MVAKVGEGNTIIPLAAEICSDCALPDTDYWEKSFMMGAAKLYILSVLSKGRNHGYGVLKAITDKSGGCCSVTAGTIYPILRELEREGLITSSTSVVGGRRRVTYEITEKGREVFEKGLVKWETHVEGVRKILER